MNITDIKINAVGQILDQIYEQLKSLNKTELKTFSVLISGAVSAAIMLKAVKPFVKFVGVMFVSMSLTYASYKLVLSYIAKDEKMLSFLLMWLTAFSSYPIAKGIMELLQSLIEIISDRIKEFAKTASPSFGGLFKKNKNNGTI